MKEKKTAAPDIRTFFKRWPKFYYFISNVFGPVFFTGLSGKAFVAKYKIDGTVLNLGSGPRVLSAAIKNVDIHPYIGVDIVADIMAVPMPDGSVSGVISDNVLEHVEDPVRAVAEMHRLLKSGGLAYIATPYLYPFHASPSDYYRWSKNGLRLLFKDFEVVEEGVRGGPFSTLDVYLCHLTGLLLSFGSDMLYSLFTNIAIFIFFPIKFLDIIFAHIPNADYLSTDLYIVVKKR